VSRFRPNEYVLKGRGLMGPRGIYVRASARAADIALTTAELQAAGATSLRQIAAGLNAKGIPTARGEGEWTALQVKRVLKRLVR
jgi:hypothetical protein